MPHLMPGAQPFFHRGDSTGVLLIHGFTGAPKEMRPLGEALVVGGQTVLGLRLPQHGTAPNDMFHSRASDWFQAAVDGYHLLTDQCERVFVMGLSMGGALALWLAAHYPVAGVVAMSTPSQPFDANMDWRAGFAVLFSVVMPYVPKQNHTVTDPVALAQRVAYPTYPTIAIPQFRAVIRQAWQALPQVKVPTLVAHSRDDVTVPAINSDYIFNHISSASKSLLWLERSGHVITEGAENGQLFARVLAFMQTAEV